MHSQRTAYRGLAAAFVVGAASLLQAQVSNGGFEEGGGSFTSWGTSGDAFISDHTIFPTPAQGQHQATLATYTDGSFLEPAGVGTSGYQAETNLGLDHGLLTGVGNGNVDNVSSITQTIHLNVGEKLRFKFNFLTNQTNNDPSAPDYAQRPSLDQDDFAFLSLSGAGGSKSVLKLIDVFYGFHDGATSAPNDFTTGFMTTPATDPFISASGYLSGTFTALASDDYVVGFGVANAFTGSNNGVSSGLLVDDVRVEPVPEPACMAVLGLGLAGVLRRRSQKPR